MDPEDTLPPDPLGSTLPAPPPVFFDSVDQEFASGVQLVDRHALRSAWFYTDHPDWDGFASEALDDE